MYLAMNRFQIVTGKEKIFEKLWTNRDTYLESVKGFKSFNLIRVRQMKPLLYMHLIVFGFQNTHSLIGQSLKHLGKHIKMLGVLKTYILAIQNLRDLK